MDRDGPEDLPPILGSAGGQVAAGGDAEQMRKRWFLVWSDLVWSGLVWSGLVWSSLVWSGLEQVRTRVVLWSGLVRSDLVGGWYGRRLSYWLMRLSDGECCLFRVCQVGLKVCVTHGRNVQQ